MPNGAALAVAAFLFLLGVVVAHRAVDQTRLVRRLRSIETTHVGDAGPPFRLVRGRLETDAPLESPYQRRPCVYYFFRVIEPWTPGVASPRRFETVHEGLAKIPPDLASFFDKAGIDEKHLPRLPRFTVHEYTLEPGDDVYVLGTLEAEKGRFVRAKRRPLVVSAERDVGLADALRNELLLYAPVAPMLLLTALGIGWLGATA